MSNSTHIQKSARKAIQSLNSETEDLINLIQTSTTKIVPRSNALEKAILRRIFAWMILNYSFIFGFVLIFGFIFNNFGMDRKYIKSLLVQSASVVIITSLAIINFVYDWSLTIPKISYSVKLLLSCTLSIIYALAYAFCLTNILNLKFKDYTLVSFICIIQSFKFLHNYYNSNLNQIILTPASSNLLFEIKRLFIFKNSKIPFFQNIIESLKFLSLILVFLVACPFISAFFNILNILLFKNNLWVINYILLNINLILNYHLIKVCYISFFTSFFFETIVLSAITSVKHFILYPLDFSKLESSNKAMKTNNISYLTNVLLFKEIDSSVTKGSEPLWRDYLISLQRDADTMANKLFKLEYCGCNFLSFLAFKFSSTFENIGRILAYQDLVRCIKSNAGYRKSLFSQEWDVIVYNSCTLLNSLTLQIQAVIAHALTEVFPKQFVPTYKSPLIPVGSLSKNWSGNIKWGILSSCEQDKSLREESIFGYLILILSQHSLFGTNVFKRIIGCVIQTTPIPISLIQAALHVSEALSIGIVYAKNEDILGHSYSLVPMIITSLLGLQFALRDYSDMYQKSRHFSRPNTAKNKKIHGKFGSTELYALSNAIEEALNRIFTFYHDIIPSFSYPEIYSVEIQNRIDKFSNR